MAAAQPGSRHPSGTGGVAEHSAATDLDACPAQRNDSAVRADAHTHLALEIARLGVLIGREAAAVDTALNDHPSTSDHDYPRWGWVEHKELSRQLDALHKHVARATARSHDQADLRAEFATLLPFAKILRADAATWRTAFEAGLKEVERRETALRQARERSAAERETLLRRRDALQLTVDETAGRIAQASGGDCRKTLPVIRLGEALTVCSVAVLSPRKWFRSQRHWLVTLNDSRDRVRVRRG